MPRKKPVVEHKPAAEEPLSWTSPASIATFVNYQHEADLSDGGIGAGVLHLAREAAHRLATLLNNGYTVAVAIKPAEDPEKESSIIEVRLFNSRNYPIAIIEAPFTNAGEPRRD